MSTSDPGVLDLGQDPTGELRKLPGLSGLVPANLPDPSTLARLANEFFNAAPGGAQPATTAQQGIDPSSLHLLATVPVTPPSAPPEISLPSNPHFPSAPASAGPAVVAPATTTLQAGPPAVPGALAGSIPAQGAGVPGYSFLADARPIFGGADLQPVGVYPAAQPITSFVQPTHTPTSPAVPVFEGATVQPLPTTNSSTMPASFGFADAAALPAFSFLDEARPIFPTQPETPAPVELDDLPAANAAVPIDGPGAEYAGFAPSTLPSFTFLQDARGIHSTTPTEAPTAATLEPDVPQQLRLSSYEFDAASVKNDFPILRERVNGRPLVWLDNAATTQKPQSVIDRLVYYYQHENSNVHRAAHELAARSTDAYEAAREKVRRFVNAPSTREIIFVRGATEGINLIAQSWGRQNIKKDDEIVVTVLEHHANIVPWQMLCAETGARLRVAPVDSTGQILLDEYEKLLGPRTRLVSITQVSNALGTVTPAAAMIASAHRHGAKVLLDGAQSVSHLRTDVQALDCDFFVFSGHKVYAPTGIGVVFGKAEILEQTQPWQGGGNMIADVTFEKTLYQPPPSRFEAGTGNIADAVGLGAAIDYLDRFGMETIARHEHELLMLGTQLLSEIPGLCIIGTAKEKAGVLSFVMDGFRTEQIGEYLNRNGIAVRSGHHCAQPILRRFGLESTVRASLALYNTQEDIEALATALRNLRLGHTSVA